MCSCRFASSSRLAETFEKNSFVYVEIKLHIISADIRHLQWPDMMIWPLFVPPPAPNLSFAENDKNAYIIPMGNRA